jgi:hypothetical protein
MYLTYNGRRPHKVKLDGQIILLAPGRRQYCETVAKLIVESGAMWAAHDAGVIKIEAERPGIKQADTVVASRRPAIVPPPPPTKKNRARRKKQTDKA